MILIYIMSFLKNTTDVHNYCYEMDATRWNGVYRKSRDEWKYKIEKQDKYIEVYTSIYASSSN